MSVDQITSAELSKKIWSLSNVLRDDGIVFHKYMSELTYLLFLKVADQTRRNDPLPKGCRWSDLLSHPMNGLVGVYRKMLTQLGEDSATKVVREIFGFPTTVFTHDENLHKVVHEIDNLNWREISGEAFGFIYESLLERNATEARSGAGQYFTPRPLVDCIVRTVAPMRGEIIQDPAVGTGGFLTSANEFIARMSAKGTQSTRFEGVEIERDTYRLCVMNVFLHDIDGKIVHGDALTDDVGQLSRPNLILANPPFGSSAGGVRPKRADLPFQTSNKQLMFLQHIYRSLASGGRAAVIVPDNVLFEPGMGKRIRQDLMQSCDLRVVLRLPQGIFYAQGVNTNVLFFKSGEPTSEIAFYDMRTNVRRFSKRNLLSSETFKEFEEICAEPFSTKRKKFKPLSSADRLRIVSRKAIAARDENLDISWLPRSRSTAPEVEDIDQLLTRISDNLQVALRRVEDVEREILG